MSLREALVAAKLAYSKIPADRREKLDKRFDAATEKARAYATYRRPS